MSWCLEGHSEVSALPPEVGSGIPELTGIAGSKQSSSAWEVFCSADERPLKFKFIVIQTFLLPKDHKKRVIAAL